MATIFCKIPISVLSNGKLTLRDIKVYGAISSFLGNKKTCFPSLAKLSERSGLHIVNVSRAIQRLRRFGLLKVVRRGKTLSNVYELVFPKSDLVDSAKSQLKSDLVDSAKVIKLNQLNHSTTELKKNPSKQAGNAKNEAKKSDLNFRKEHLKEYLERRLREKLLLLEIEKIFNRLRANPKNRIFSNTQLWLKAKNLVKQQQEEVVNEPAATN